MQLTKFNLAPPSDSSLMPPRGPLSMSTSHSSPSSLPAVDGFVHVGTGRCASIGQPQQRINSDYNYGAATLSECSTTCADSFRDGVAAGRSLQGFTFEHEYFGGFAHCYCHGGHVNLDGEADRTIHSSQTMSSSKGKIRGVRIATMDSNESLSSGSDLISFADGYPGADCYRIEVSIDMKILSASLTMNEI